MSSEISPEEVSQLATLVPYHYLMENVSLLALVQGISKVVPGPVTLSWMVNLIDRSSGTGDEIKSVAPQIWYYWKEGSRIPASSGSRIGSRNSSCGSSRSSSRSNSRPCSRPESPPELRVEDSGSEGSDLPTKLVFSKQPSSSNVALSSSHSSISRPNKRISTTFSREVLLAALNDEGNGPILNQSRVRTPSREVSPPKVRSSNASLVHLVVAHPRLLDCYKRSGGNMAMDIEIPSSGTTLEEWAKSNGLLSDLDRDINEQVLSQNDLSLALSGRLELAPLLRKWKASQLEEAALEVMAFDLVTIDGPNIDKLLFKLLKLQDQVSTANWNRILQVLDRHFIHRLLHWCGNEEESLLLSRFLSLFPRVQPFIESIKKHGRWGLLSCLRSGIIRHLGGVPSTVKLTPQKKMEIVDMMLTDTDHYATYIREVNAQSLQLFQDQIPWDTTIDVEPSTLNFPPSDIVWYCDGKSVIRSVLRGQSHKDARVGRQLERLRQETSDLELLEPRPFLSLLNMLLSQLDNISLI